MAKKTIPFNKSGIGRVPDDKPVVYRILTEGGRNNYTGIAKRGRAQERLQEHLDGTDRVPGVKVQVEQVNTIAEARALEAQVIAGVSPKYNKQGT